jgi:hypothetical protein
MIFLHPVILQNDAQNNSITEGKYNFMRQLQLRSDVSGGKENVLPPWNTQVQLPQPFD